MSENPCRRLRHGNQLTYKLNVIHSFQLKIKSTPIEQCIGNFNEWVGRLIDTR